ncbi:MAG: FitA-like ribbon-helix-helix domain-containing protein [Lacipirellulaceae bacterium]
MAELTVRNLDDSVRDELDAMAREAGKSVEETVEDILRREVEKRAARANTLGARIAARFRGVGLSEEIPELRGQPATPPVLGQ